jgi:hypothetical protein
MALAGCSETNDDDAEATTVPVARAKYDDVNATDFPDRGVDDASTLTPAELTATAS